MRSKCFRWVLSRSRRRTAQKTILLFSRLDVPKAKVHSRSDWVENLSSNCLAPFLRLRRRPSRHGTKIPHPVFERAEAISEKEVLHIAQRRHSPLRLPTRSTLFGNELPFSDRGVSGTRVLGEY